MMSKCTWEMDDCSLSGLRFCVRGRSVNFVPEVQSRAQSFSSSLSAVGRRDKLWDNGIFVPEIVGHRL